MDQYQIAVAVGNPTNHLLVRHRVGIGNCWSCCCMVSSLLDINRINLIPTFRSGSCLYPGCQTTQTIECSSMQHRTGEERAAAESVIDVSCLPVCVTSHWSISWPAVVTFCPGKSPINVIYECRSISPLKYANYRATRSQESPMTWMQYPTTNYIPVYLGDPRCDADTKASQRNQLISTKYIPAADISQTEQRQQ